MADELTLYNYNLDPESDVWMKGEISHTGGSSMEVLMEVYRRERRQ